LTLPGATSGSASGSLSKAAKYEAILKTLPGPFTLLTFDFPADGVVARDLIPTLAPQQA
jgi:hypothetical protein